MSEMFNEDANLDSVLKLKKPKTVRNENTTASTKTKGLSRTRVRRNTLERKCLSKEFKRLFAGSSRTVFLLAISADRVARHGNLDRIGAEAFSRAKKIFYNPKALICFSELKV